MPLSCQLPTAFQSLNNDIKQVLRNTRVSRIQLLHRSCIQPLQVLHCLLKELDGFMPIRVKLGVALSLNIPLAQPLKLNLRLQLQAPPNLLNVFFLVAGVLLLKDHPTLVLEVLPRSLSLASNPVSGAVPELTRSRQDGVFMLMVKVVQQIVSRPTGQGKEKWWRCFGILYPQCYSPRRRRSRKRIWIALRFFRQQGVIDCNGAKVHQATILVPAYAGFAERFLLLVVLSVSPDWCHAINECQRKVRRSYQAIGNVRFAFLVQNRSGALPQLTV